MSRLVWCPPRPSPLRPLLLMRLALGGALLLTACDDRHSASEPETVTRMQLRIVSGDEQVAPTAEVVPAPLVVRVTDQANRPLAGIRIRWTLLEPGGFRGPSPPAAMTDGNGQASLSRRLGYMAGAYRTIAAVAGDTASSVAFTSFAHVQGATRMQPADAPGVTVADTVLATLAPHRLLVLDHQDRPVAGIVVTWVATDGTLSGHTSTTDASGIAQVTHILSRRSGPQNILAQVAGLQDSPVTFPVTALPGNPVAFAAVAGLGQIGRVSTQVQPYSVGVVDAYGNGHHGLTVNWRVDAGGGSVDQPSSVTTKGGIPGEMSAAATTSHRLGLDENLQVVTATLAGISAFSPVSFATVAVTQVVGVFEGDCPAWWEIDCDPTFSPSAIEIPAGRSVLWNWSSSVHDVVFEDDPSPPVSAARTSAGRHVRTFAQAGTYRYRCTLHSTSFTDGMVGTVVVR